MQIFRNSRQQRYDNVQKELLSNYYSHQYQTIMAKIPTPPEYTRPPEAQRVNFKDLLASRKQQNYYSQHSNSNEIRLNFKTTMKQKQQIKEEQQNKKIVKKLQASLINELYKSSPGPIQKGHYNKIQIRTKNGRQNTQRSPKRHQESIQSQFQSNIQVTIQQSQDEEDSQPSPQKIAVYNAIKKTFKQRQQRSISPKRKSHSLSKSSSISQEPAINSPKKLVTPNRLKQSNKQQSLRAQSVPSNSSNHRSRFQPQSYVYASQQYPIDKGALNNYDQDIQFIPPSNNNYKSLNPNLVEESFRFQQKVRSQYGQDSERAHSIASSDRNQSPSVNENNSKEKKNRKGSFAQSKAQSKLSVSFISSLSMVPIQEAPIIRKKIQKELYQNQLGPYQSVLYGVLQLMDVHPRSRPVLAVGKKMLQDRKAFQEKRVQQERQIDEYKKMIDLLKKKNVISRVDKKQEKIRSKKLEILRLVRKISTKI